MAVNLECSGDEEEDEDYIDMELASSSSSSSSREFEFKMAFACNDTEPTAFPADKLFYKGKLLPLLLPPRRLMVQNLLRPPVSGVAASGEDCYSSFSMPLSSIFPLDSCNISPSESCRVSCELNPDEEYLEFSTELDSFISSDHLVKKPWQRKLKLKLIKHSNLGRKLKASRGYLKSWFSKSDEIAAEENGGDTGKSQKESKKYAKIFKKIPFGQMGIAPCPSIASIIKSIDKNGNTQDNAHRRSFSGAIKRHSPSKCLSPSSSNSSSSSSSSSSVNSSGSHDLQFIRRSASVTEIESSIEAAIAHCRKSQHVLDPAPETTCL